MNMPESFKGYYNPHTGKHMISALGILWIFTIAFFICGFIGIIMDSLK